MSICGLVNSESQEIQVSVIALTCNNVVKKSCWHAKNPNKKVTDGEVEDKEVGDGAHVFAPQDNEAHHSISDHTDQEYEQV